MADGLDLSTVQILNSPDTRGWPATATITKLEFRATGVHVEHTKRLGPGAWPSFRPAGWDGDLQYTLWIFLNINGQWRGCGGIQFWQDCDQNGGPPEEFAKNWYYDVNRWGPMTGYQPKPGELVGFMVSAGDARGLGLHPIDERSTVVLMPFPSSGGVYVAPAVPEPQPQPGPGPVPTPTPDPLPAPVPPSVPSPLDPNQFDTILQRFDSLDRQFAQARTDVKTAGVDLLKQLPGLLRKALLGR